MIPKAKELTDKGFCSTKNMYYHGSKFHPLAFSRPGHLPFPESLIVTPASENDLYSTAVLKIRQPIEALFNWLIEKTDTQRASKVRSSNGLIIQILRLNPK